jgi:outer membrane protein
MKKFFLLALGLMIATLGFSQKFGYCNSGLLLTQIPEVKAADSDLQAFQTQLTKKGQEMVKSPARQGRRIGTQTTTGFNFSEGS